METQVQSHRSAKSLEKNLSPISLFKNFLIKPFVFAVISSSCRPRIFQALPARGSRAGVSVQQKVITHCAEFTAPARDVFWGCFSDYFTESSRKPDLTRVPAPPRPAPCGAPRGGENLFSREGSAAYSAPTQQVIEWAQAAVWFPVSEEGMNPSPRAVSGGSRTRGPRLLRQDELRCGRRLPAAGSSMGETGENPRAEAAVSSPGARLVPPLQWVTLVGRVWHSGGGSLFLMVAWPCWGLSAACPCPVGYPGLLQRFRAAPMLPSH